jgi:hypothetical protein
VQIRLWPVHFGTNDMAVTITQPLHCDPAQTLSGLQCIQTRMRLFGTICLTIPFGWQEELTRELEAAYGKLLSQLGGGAAGGGSNVAAAAAVASAAAALQAGPQRSRRT